MLVVECVCLYTISVSVLLRALPTINSTHSHITIDIILSILSYQKKYRGIRVYFYYLFIHKYLRYSIACARHHPSIVYTFGIWEHSIQYHHVLFLCAFCSAHCSRYRALLWPRWKKKLWSQRRKSVLRLDCANGGIFVTQPHLI